MGEPAIPPAADRVKTRDASLAIVASVVNDEAMPLPFEWPKNTPLDCPDCPVSDAEAFIFQLAQEVTLLQRQLLFIRQAAFMLGHGVIENMKKLAGDITAACDGTLPEWWDKHG